MANAIEKFPVALIFKKIFKDSLTGQLIVKSADVTRNIYFLKGRLAFASSTAEEERLGEVLISAGKLTRRQLEELLRIQKTEKYRGRKIGELAVKFVKLGMRDIFLGLQDLVKGIACATFGVVSGEWRFIMGKHTITNKQQFKIKVPEVLGGALKQLADISFFKKKFFFRAPVTTMLSGDLSELMGEEEAALYRELTGYANTSVEKIMIKKGIDSNDSGFWRKLILFYVLNIADFVEFTIDEEQNKNVEEINEMYDKINESGEDYYKVLGVSPAAPREKIKEIYDDISSKYDPQKLNVAPDSTVMVRADEVYKQIKQAYDVLGDKEKKKEYDIKSYKEKYKKESVDEGPKVNSRDLYLKANLLHKQKRFYEAAVLLEKAVELEPRRANYYMLLGICQSKVPSMKNQAVKSLEKVTELEPWNADPMFALGELYRSENMAKKAEHYFKKALEINMEHTLAGKAMKDMGRLFAPPKKSLFTKK